MAKKILIVEDEFIVANGLRLILEQAGYRVNGIAGSVEEADRMISGQLPDLVLLDIRLNGKKTGIDLAKKLRSDNIAFIYLSANSSHKVLEDAKATEPYGFLVKPFREKELLIMLDIAWYRHENSLESKLRQEEALQKRLTEILTDRSGPSKKLSYLARMLQPHIPFDVIALGQRPIQATGLSDMAYLRTGLDEYQFIGNDEMENITALQQNPLSQIIDENEHSSDEPSFYHTLPKGTHPAKNLDKILFDSFKVESYLALPVSLSDGTKAFYYFFSRQREVYEQHHSDLLLRIKPCLQRVTNDLMSGSQIGSTKENVRISHSTNQGQDSLHRSFKGIIGSHPVLLSALDLTMQVAPYNTSVLILGESGTGKERVAHAIHTISHREKKAFIKVNCAAIPDTLIESELFGHEKGAFTGAIEKRQGRFEQAEGGTIFLDEIAELPLEMQVKLLRVLQEKEVDRIGGRAPVKVDVRVVAATSRDLEHEVATGKFRLDLYYRLNVFPITLPPLRERKSDIPALSQYFAQKFCNDFNKKFTGIAQSMLEELLNYHWPGNIRELENVVERSVILHDEGAELTLKKSLAGVNTTPTVAPRIDTLEDLKQVQREAERGYILAVLKKADGRIRGVDGAAELLNLKPTTLESKMAKLGIRKEDYSGPNNS